MPYAVKSPLGQINAPPVKMFFCFFFVCDDTAESSVINYQNVFLCIYPRFVLCVHLFFMCLCLLLCLCLPILLCLLSSWVISLTVFWPGGGNWPGFSQVFEIRNPETLLADVAEGSVINYRQLQLDSSCIFWDFDHISVETCCTSNKKRSATGSLISWLGGPEPR